MYYSPPGALGAFFLVVGVAEEPLRQALKSPHANHVLQKAIALMPPKKLDFVVLELRGTPVGPYACIAIRRRIRCLP